MNWRERAYQEYVTSGQSSFSDASHSLSERKPHLQSVIQRFMPAEKEISVLDIGCGYGAFLYFLKQAGYRNLSGVDFSEQQVEIAHELGLPEVMCGSVEDKLAQTPDEAVDVVVAMDLLEHLEMADLFMTLDEIYRLLKPGGKLIASVPNAEGLYGMRILYGDITHYSAFTPRSISQILKIIGFSNIACFESKPIAHGVKSSLRRLIWEVGTLPHRLMLAAETGQTRFVLTQTMLFTAYK